ncbi:hypothetical protein CG724_29085 [Streptomyces sp. CB02120-2]|nr:hypothetical protein CG724_29085 [Streptomyces sp. CB02120-2]
MAETRMFHQAVARHPLPLPVSAGPDAMRFRAPSGGFRKALGRPSRIGRFPLRHARPSAAKYA